MESDSTILAGLCPWWSFSCEGKAVMDVHAMLKALERERELVNQAIVTLEILARGKEKRRGRPPRWLCEGREERPSRPKTQGRKSLNRGG